MSLGPTWDEQVAAERAAQAKRAEARDLAAPTDEPAAVKRHGRGGLAPKALAVYGGLTILAAVVCSAIASLLTARFLQTVQQPAGETAPAHQVVQVAPVRLAPVEPSNDYLEWKLERTLPWSFGETSCVAFSLDGKTIAVAGGTSVPTPLPQGGYGEFAQTGAVCVWDATTGATMLTVREPADEIVEALFLRAGHLLLGHRRGIKLIDSRSGAVRFDVAQSCVRRPTYSAERELLVLDAGRILDARNGQHIGTYPIGSSDCVAFSPDGLILYADGWIYAADTWERAQLRVPPTEVAAFSHDGRTVATGFALWGLGERAPIWQLRRSPGNYLTGIAFTPDDRFILTSDRIGELNVRIAASGKIAAAWRPHKAVAGMALSRDGSRLVTIGEEPGEPVRVWRAAQRATKGKGE
jgi:WD40 repeat protein